MTVIELLKEYENLSDSKKELFRTMMDMDDKREAVAEQLKQFQDKNGEPYISEDWIDKNILKKND